MSLIVLYSSKEQRKLLAIASLLEITMTNAGIMDDYDEIIGDYIDNDKEGAAKYHEDVMTGLEFINEHIPDSNYDITRDGSGRSGNHSFHLTYVEMLETS